jgi:hypothetical protein
MDDSVVLTVLSSIKKPADVAAYGPKLQREAETKQIIVAL